MTSARLRVQRCEASEAMKAAEAALAAAKGSPWAEAKALLGMAKVMEAKDEMKAARNLEDQLEVHLFCLWF